MQEALSICYPGQTIVLTDFALQIFLAIISKIRLCRPRLTKSRSPLLHGCSSPLSADWDSQNARKAKLAGKRFIADSPK